VAYDKDNIFAKILRGEIPNDTVHEDDHTLAFRDINPQTPTHVLVIPKGEYESLTDFAENASDAEIAAVIRTAAKVAKDEGVTEDGYRVLTNVGRHGHQEVQHLHFHVFGGKPLGRMIKPPEK